MGITAAVTRAACNTGVGNQDITTADLGGLTPKAAYFVVTRATSDGVAAANAVLGIGAATATDERWACGQSCQDNVASSNTRRRGMTDECVLILDPSDGSVDGEADFVSFITNGVRINWGNAPASAYLLTVVLFAGTDLSAHAGTFTLGNQDVETNVNTVGFEPDVLLTASPLRSMDDTTQGYTVLSYGAVANKSPVVQLCLGIYDQHGQGSSAAAARITDDYGTVYPDWDGSMYWGAEFGSFDADGFSCWPRSANSNSDVGFLALAFSSAVDFWAGIVDSPTSTGNQSQTGPGFKPQFVLCGVTQMPAVDTAYTDANAGSVGISAFDADDEYCSSVQNEDGQATMDTQSLSDDTAINLPDDDGSAAHVASFVSFDTGGWTWNFSATEGTAEKYWALAIEQSGIAVLRRRREGY